MTYNAGDFIELPSGKTVRLNKETAEIAEAAARIEASYYVELEDGGDDE